jgi:hypothetical protein
MINPTNCSPFAISSEGVGDQGTPAAFSSYFNAVNCSTLGFTPRFSITQLGGQKATHRSQDPSLSIELNTTPGDANIKSIAVTLPKAFEIDQRHLGNICDRSELASDQCAGKEAIGVAITESPLLEKPLKGPVYAVSGFGILPHLAFILAGQVTLMPEAESSSVQNGRLKTVVPVVPDAPIGHFRFTLFGGSKGLPLKHREPLLCPDRKQGRIQRPKRQDGKPGGEDEGGVCEKEGEAGERRTALSLVRVRLRGAPEEGRQSRERERVMPLLERRKRPRARRF